MLVGELVEMIGQDLCGIDHFRSLLHEPYLKEQALTKITGSDSSRFELLNDLQHVQHLLLISLYIRSERKVVRYPSSSRLPIMNEATAYWCSVRLLYPSCS